MSSLESQILHELEREDPEEADAFREQIQEEEDILADFEREFVFDGPKQKK